MRIDILTLFPGMFTGPLTESILKRATDAGLLDIHLHDIRKYSTDRHNKVDDKPYGGGAGMLMAPGPVVACIEAVTEDGKKRHKKPHRIYLSARGKRLTQSKVERLGKKDWLVLLCGHYEGVDQRVIDGWIDEEVSIGDYVLTGGEIPAMVLTDAVARQISGVVGKEASADLDSFSKSFGRKREHPHYTRPEDFRGRKVPEVLLSGNHKNIEEWRQSLLH
jgi:tRNA (guanine37-N1)-methyltransferase